MSSGDISRERTVGFIGLGVMGRPMAHNLLRAGYPLVVHSRSAGPVAELAAAGARAVASPAEVAASAAIMITMLPGSAEVELVIAGPLGLATRVRPGDVVIDMSTIDPAVARRLAQHLAARGTALLDAPVSGGEIGAHDATMSIMVGGSPDAFDRVRPVLESLGGAVTYCGEAGAGQIAKACNQLIVASTIQAVAEALVLAAAAGVSPQRVREALLAGFAASRVLEVHGQRMIDRDFRPGGRVALQSKDAQIALHIAERLGVPLPGLQVAAANFQQLVDRGDGNLDHAALSAIVEEAANLRL